MKHLLLVLFAVLSSASTLVWQTRHAEVLRRNNASIRAQLNQDEQIALHLERQNESTRKLLEERESDLADLQNRLATAAKLAATLSLSSGQSNGWRDDVPFVRLSKEHLTSLSMGRGGIVARNVANGYHLAAPAATLLGLGSEELSAVNEAIRILCEQYLAIELAHAPQIPKYERTREGIESAFAIPNLKSEGAELKRLFIESLTGAIGQMRTDLILQYGGDYDFYHQLAGFGENAKTIELVELRDDRGNEQIKAYVHLNGPRNGGYIFKLPADDNDPNANLCRALWERVQAVGK